MFNWYPEIHPRGCYNPKTVHIWPSFTRTDGRTFRNLAQLEVEKISQNTPCLCRFISRQLSKLFQFRKSSWIPIFQILDLCRLDTDIEICPSRFHNIMSSSRRTWNIGMKWSEENHHYTCFYQYHLSSGTAGLHWHEKIGCKKLSPSFLWTSFL